MKRYISMLLLLLVCFLLQTTLFQSLKIAGVIPNLILVVTAISGLMYGRRMGMLIGVVCGLLVDLLYSSVIGLNILFYVLIGYVNGSANRLYFKEDYVIPFIAVALSDLAYGILYYVCNFLLRGRLHFFFYLRNIIIPEMICTLLAGICIYLFVKWLDRYIDPVVEVPLKAKKPFEE